MGDKNFCDLISERERLIESLIKDQSRNLWVADDSERYISSVMERLPLPVLRQLSEIDFRFLAPEKNQFGRTTRLNGRTALHQLVVFISPEVLKCELAKIEAVIAHELAHVILKHEESYSPDAYQEALRGEEEADALVKSWGFSLQHSSDPR